MLNVSFIFFQVVIRQGDEIEQESIVYDTNVYEGDRGQANASSGVSSAQGGNNQNDNDYIRVGGGVIEDHGNNGR